MIKIRDGSGARLWNWDNLMGYLELNWRLKLSKLEIKLGKELTLIVHKITKN